MTYKELKNRLNKCEYALKAIKDGSHKDINTIDVQKTTTQLNIIKENLQAQIKQLKEGNSKTYLVTPKKGQTTAVSLGDDEKDALKDADDVKAIKGIDGEEIKEGIEFSLDETKSIAKKVGKAVAKALKDSGDDVAHMKATNIETNSFEIYVEYKNNSEDSFAFHLSKNKLHLADFSFNKALVDVSVKPSGEPIIHIDVLANELVKHFTSLRETKVNEDPYQTTYIKVGRRDYKKAMSILDSNLDPTYVKMDIVDDDGDGNAIIYFNFRASDDGEPGENVEAFIYDAASDLQAQGIHVTGSSHDIDESTDINDPVLMKMRALKSKLAKKKGIVKGGERHTGRKTELLANLKAKRAQVMRDMEQEAEPEGGPIADKYGDILNKIDAAIAKASGRKKMDYDTAVGKVNEEEGHLVTFGYDLDRIEDVVKHLQSKYKEGQDFELHIGRGDDLPNAVTLKNPALEDDHDLNDMLNAAQSDQDRYDAYTDYDQRRKEDDDYYEDPNYHKESVKNSTQMHEDEEEDAKNDADYAQGWHDDPRQDEDTDVGHQDDEPSMLSATARETAEYSAKLLKKLQAYDQHDGEVDFPNWWQSKLILAREYMSAAFHYLDSEEKQPAIDQLALESSIKEGRGDFDDVLKAIENMSNNDDISERDAAAEIVLALADKFQLPVDKNLEDYMQENVDKVAGGIPYRQHGNKVIISEPLDDATKERLIQKAEDHGYFAQPNMAGGITITLKKGTYEGENTKAINEYASRDLDEIFGALGYRQGFDEFIEDNPGCVEVIMEWIGSISDFQRKLSDEYSQEELENLGFYYGDIDEGRKDDDALFPDNPRLSEIKNLADKIVSMVKAEADKGELGYIKTMEELRYQQEDDFERTPEWNKAKGIRSDFDDYGSGTNEGRNVDDLYDTTVHTMKRLAKKYKEGDKSVVPHLKKLTDIKKKLEQEKIKKASNIGKDQEIEEAGPGFKHDCAAKVIHKEHGAGNTIPEKHTLVKEGNKYVVTHYDVLFENGNTVLDIPVNELDIKTTNEHWHKGYKKKKK